MVSIKCHIHAFIFEYVSSLKTDMMTYLHIFHCNHFLPVFSLHWYLHIVNALQKKCGRNHECYSIPEWETVDRLTKIAGYQEYQREPWQASQVLGQMPMKLFHLFHCFLESLAPWPHILEPPTTYPDCMV